MDQKKNWFEELFPGWLDRFLGIAGFGVSALLSLFPKIPDEIRQTLILFGLFILVWIGIKVFINVLDIANSNRRSGIKVKTNLGGLTLNTVIPEEEDGAAKVTTDVGLCLCICNHGKPTSCTVTLRSPSFLQLKIQGAEGQSTVIRNDADCHVRKFQLARGEIQFVTITKFVLLSDMAQRYRETTKTLRIEVTEESGSILEVLEIHVGI